MLMPTPSAAPRALRRPVLPAIGDAATGRLLVVLAFAVAGLGSPLAKTALDLGATPLSFLGVRLATAVLVLAVVCRGSAFAPGARRIGLLMLLGVGFSAQSLAYFSALERAAVPLVVAVVSAYPLVIITLDAVSARTRPSGRRMAGMGVAVLGLWLAAGTPRGAVDAGIGLALVSAVVYATYLRVSARHLTTTTPRVATLWVMTGALCGIAVACVATGQVVPPVLALGTSALHGAVATTIPIVSVYAALRRIPAADMAAIGPLEPVVATAVALGLMGERMTSVETAGAALLVLAALVMAEVRPRAALPRLPFAVPTAALMRRTRRLPSS